MKFRKDITEYIATRLGDDYYKKKDYKIFEQDGFLYAASYSPENKNKILCFINYSLLWPPETQHIKKEVEEKFNVLFAGKGCDILCKCGEKKSFSAFYGNYRISLKCNECGSSFSAYSG